MNRALTALALAGTASAAAAQPVLHFDADATAVYVGQTVTWTVSLSGVPAGDFVTGYDFDILVTVNGVPAGAGDMAFSTTFSDALSPLLNPTQGTIELGALTGVSGAQSSVLDPGGLTFGDVILGTFQTQITGAAVGPLSVTVVDGGVFAGTDVVRTRTGSDFGPISYDGLPAIQATSLFIPAPATAALLAAAGALAPRRRRSQPGA